MFQDKIQFKDEKINHKTSTIFKDNIQKCKGHVSAWIIEKDKVLHHSKHNTIVSLSSFSLCHAISSNTHQLSHFKLGIGGHEPDNVLIPIPAEISDEDLEISTYSQLLTTFIYSNDGTSVTYQITVPKGNANIGDAYAYTEAGLFTNSGALLFSRDTFPAMIKTPNREFYFEWAIQF